jgi:hypothetical protein
MWQRWLTNRHHQKRPPTRKAQHQGSTNYRALPIGTGIHRVCVWMGLILARSTPRVYGTAANYLGGTPRAVCTVDAPATLAAATPCATDRDHVTQRHVGLFNQPAMLAYRLIPRVFDVLIKPLPRAPSFTSGPSGGTTGNVFGPPIAKSAAEAGT